MPKKPIANITNWSIELGFYNTGQAAMWGTVTNHPNKELNHRYIRTSPVVRITETEVETENTIYVLGHRVDKAIENDSTIKGD